MSYYRRSFRVLVGASLLFAGMPACSSAAVGRASDESLEEQKSGSGDGDGYTDENIDFDSSGPILAEEVEGAGGAGSALEPCLRLMSFGAVGRGGAVPGGDGMDAVVAWLNDKSNALGTHFPDKPEITPEFLASFDLLLLQNLSGFAWEASETEAVENWVRAGGAILSLAGYTASGEEVLPTNELLSFSGLNYVGISGSGDTATALNNCSFCLGSSYQQEGWSRTHPIAKHVDAVGAHLGRSIGGEGDLVAQEEGKVLGMTREIDLGRVFLFHDDWISHAGTWDTPAMAECSEIRACSDKSTRTTYQVAQLWYNALRYLVPGASCLEIDDDAIVHQSRE